MNRGLQTALRIGVGMPMLLVMAPSTSAITSHHETGSADRTVEVAHELEGEEAPVEKIIGSFLIAASASRPSDAWPLFCARYRIDPNWPSAELLGHAHARIAAEFQSRSEEARQSLDYLSADGRDPNEWRTEAVGRAFGEVIRGLQLDGWDVPLDVFVTRIEAQVRPGVTYFSNEPNGASMSDKELDIFWAGVESVLAGARKEVGR